MEYSPIELCMLKVSYLTPEKKACSFFAQTFCAFIDVTAILHYMQMMKSYLKQLNEICAPTGINLLTFFKQAGVPTSTYYRAKAGKDLRLSTARKVESAITSYTLHKSKTQYE